MVAGASAYASGEGCTATTSTSDDGDGDGALSGRTHKNDGPMLGGDAQPVAEMYYNAPTFYVGQHLLMPASNCGVQNTAVSEVSVSEIAKTTSTSPLGNFLKSANCGASTEFYNCEQPVAFLHERDGNVVDERFNAMDMTAAGNFTKKNVLWSFGFNYHLCCGSRDVRARVDTGSY